MLKEKRCIIRELSKEINVTQKEIEEKTGVPQSAISRYSKGSVNNYHISYLFALTSFFKERTDRVKTMEDLFVDAD